MRDSGGVASTARALAAARSTPSPTPPGPVDAARGRDPALGELETALTRLTDGHGGALSVVGDAEAVHDTANRATALVLERGVRVVAVSPRQPVSVYGLSREPGGDPVAVVVHDLERCDAITRWVACLAPPALGGRDVLWIVCSDGAAALPVGDRIDLRTPPESTGPTRWSTRCDEQTLPLLCAAAVLGTHFAVDELAELVQRPAGALVVPLTAALEAGLLTEHGHLFAFRTAADRRSLLAHHPRLDADTDRAVELLLRRDDVDRLSMLANDHVIVVPPQYVREVAARTAHRDPEAAARLLRSSDLVLDSSDRARVVSYELQAGGVDVIERLRGTLTRDRSASETFALSEVLFPWRTVEALAMAERALRAGTADPSEDLRLRSAAVVCRAYADRPVRDEVVRLGREADRSGDERSSALIGLAESLDSAARGDLLGALRRAARANEHIVEEVPSPVWWIAGIFRAKLLSDLGRLDDAEDVLDSCALGAEQRGQANALPPLLMVRATCAIERGQLVEARRLLWAARQLAHLMRRPSLVETNAVSLLVRIAHATGEPGALDELQAALEPQAVSDPARRHTAVSGLVMAADGLEDDDGLELWATDTAGVDEQTGRARYALARGLTGELTRLRVLHQRGRTTEAHRLLNLLHVVASSTRADLPVAIAQHAVGLLESRNELLDGLDAVYERLGRPVLRAQLFEDRAAASVDDATPRLSLLRQAADLYRACGADRDAARVDRHARRLGKRLVTAEPIAVERAEADELGLTPAEQRILSQLVAGQSNTQIARALFLSPHTVAVHLRRMYAKTETRGRGELVAKAVRTRSEAARRSGPGPDDVR